MLGIDTEKLAKTFVDEAEAKIIPPLQQSIKNAVQQLLDGVDGMEIKITITKKKEV